MRVIHGEASEDVFLKPVDVCEAGTVEENISGTKYDDDGHHDDHDDDDDDEDVDEDDDDDCHLPKRPGMPRLKPRQYNLFPTLGITSIKIRFVAGTIFPNVPNIPKCAQYSQMCTIIPNIPKCSP